MFQPVDGRGSLLLTRSVTWDAFELRPARLIAPASTAATPATVMRSDEPGLCILPRTSPAASRIAARMISRARIVSADGLSRTFAQKAIQATIAYPPAMNICHHAPNRRAATTATAPDTAKIHATFSREPVS